MKNTILSFGLACLAAPALASGFDAVTKMQKTGMWEVTSDPAKGKPRLYCATDKQKLDARKSLEDAGDGSCKIVHDTLSGNRFDFRMQCVIATPDKKETGTLLMTMTGSATPVDIRATTTYKVTGDSPTLQRMATFLGEARTEHWRWIRPCTAAEKAGPQ